MSIVQSVETSAIVTPRFGQDDVANTHMEDFKENRNGKALQNYPQEGKIRMYRSTE